MKGVMRASKYLARFEKKHGITLTEDQRQELLKRRVIDLGHREQIKMLLTSPGGKQAFKEILEERAAGAKEEMSRMDPEEPF